MSYNPSADKRDAVQTQLQAATQERHTHIDTLTWFRNADLDALTRQLAIERRQRDQTSHAHEGALMNIRMARGKVEYWTEQSSIGLDPRSWFSDKTAAKRHLADGKEDVAKAQAQATELKRKLDTATEATRVLALDVERLRAFNEQAVQEAVEALNSQIATLRPELERLSAQAEKIAALQREPLAKLEDLRASRADTLAGLAVAESLQRALDSAATSRERALTHGECERHFDNGNPSAVMRQLNRQLADTDREISKVERRLQKLAARGAMEVAKVVIDGNNLCYRQNTFIGLTAVQAVVSALQHQHEIIVVFDASIRRHLKMDKHAIAASFPEGVEVHVVAHKEEADETVLALATDTNAAVISNDRFTDFPEKLAVRDQRIVRHEIVDGRVFVHDLGVSALVP